MGLFKLLTFPASGPVAGTKWVLETILSEAERQHYDPALIRQQLADLEAQHRAGALSDAEYDRREEALFERLLAAREYQQRKQLRS